MTQPGTEIPQKAGARYGFIDLLRGYALVVMIETHVINAYLPNAERHSAFFFWLTFFNGLVAPTFLFASGFSIILQATRQWEDWIYLRAGFWRQMRRLGFITLVAYYSHIGPFQLSKFLRPEDPLIWKEALQVDILQCIVASLLAVHLLIFALRSRQLVAWGALLVAGTVCLSTPWMWSRDFSSVMPLSLALFLNPHGISLFPLFPWLSFLLVGSVASLFFLKSVLVEKAAACMRSLALVGVSMIASGLLLRAVPWTLPGRVDFYTTSPLYVLIRLGCVLVICSLLYAWEKRLHWIPRSVRVAGQESLLVYGLHLWVIFAFLRGKHVGPLLGLEMDCGACFALSAVIILAMLGLAALWHFLKKAYPRITKRGQAFIVVIMILVFVLR